MVQLTYCYDKQIFDKLINSILVKGYRKLLEQSKSLMYSEVSVVLMVGE